MANQIIAYGARVERSQNGTAWEAIPECKGVAIPVVTAEDVEVTSLQSPNGFREYIKGRKDSGEVIVRAGYTAAAYEQQLSDQAFSGGVYYRTYLPPANDQTIGDAFEFRGYPTPEVETGDLGAIVALNIRIRTTGAVGWTRGGQWFLRFGVWNPLGIWLDASPWNDGG